VSRVVVHGDGPAGLAVAARLARARHSVTVLASMRPVPEESLRLTLPAALRDLFLKTGRALENVLDLTAVPLLARHTLADGTVVELPNRGDRAVAAAFGDALGGRAADDWLRLSDWSRRLWDQVREPFVETPPMSHRGWYLRHPATTRQLLAGRSLHGVGRRFLRDPAQRRFLEGYASRYGGDPRRVRPALALVPWVEQTFRVWTVDGGTTALHRALTDRAAARGVGFDEPTGDVPADVVVVDRSTWEAGPADGVRLTPPDRNPAPGRFVVGDTAYPGSDVALALMSAAAVADRIGRADPPPRGPLRGSVDE
jgi:phytoene dehydrogenase-like protein